VNLDELDPVFQAAGQEWNVDPLLLKAMAGQESGGNRKAVSKAGAQGLMQIMPDTAKALGVTDTSDPVQSIWGAAKYMSQALDAEPNVEQALLNYHGGAGWRQKFGPESRAYVPAIAARYKALAQAKQQQPPSDQQAAPAPAQTAER
jgi:soluble lytic murein transglycosylase-like protein